MMMLVFGLFAIVAAYFIGTKLLAKRTVANAATASVDATLAQAGGSAPATPTSPSVILSRAQCKQICVGKCGHRPIFNTQRGKSVRDCWKMTKQQVCGWKDADDSDID